MMYKTAISVLLLSGLVVAETPTTKPASPEQILNNMLKPAPQVGKPLSTTRQVQSDATSGGGAVAPGAPVVRLRREGSYLVDATGRLTRSADGQQKEFVFESDGKTMKDPPVIILPNLWLMTMEQAAKGASRDLRFRVTGMLTEYNGRNYVLLEKVVVLPDGPSQF